ncbi:MAG: ATP-dependent RNA helicase DbpA [Spirochaetaceae bacterium]|nr:ATP-dependent RNA helicase DbpA [Spirochaetaceae bacterium]
MKPFTHLSLSEAMMLNLKNLKYDIMTPIQELSIPPILKGKDILAQAKTGSGKTAAFGIGMLENLDVNLFQIQNLILCPTRELSEQVSGELRRIAKFRPNIKILNITGGVQMRKQELSLKHQAHIIVGTPGRIRKLLERDSLQTGELKTLVLDEADRMLDMGFMEELQSILEYLPSNRQTLCFSATFPGEIRDLGRSFMKDPREITVDALHHPEVIEQRFFEVLPGEKIGAINGILNTFNPDSALIFCNTKDSCRKTSEQLNKLGYHSLALHGDLDQSGRTEVLIRFTNGSSRILVATDVAARGLDIDSIGAVINFDVPFESETYVHRIGRTGRAGKGGLAFSLIRPREIFRLDYINEYLKSNYTAEKPDFTGDSQISGMQPEMITLSINAGRKNKISAGDLLGALTSKGGISGGDVGRIDRLDTVTFVAVRSSLKKRAVGVLESGTIKGRRFKVMIRDGS